MRENGNGGGMSRETGMTYAYTMLAALAAYATSSCAQQTRPGSYPDKPVRLIVGTAPSGGLDVTARIVAHKLGERWNSSIVVENRSGASGGIAMELVANANPDGYTMLIAGTQTMVATPLRRVSFDVRKVYAPIVRMTSSPYVLVISPVLPVATVKELIAYAKGKPGVLNYGSSGNGTLGHLAAELFKSLTGTDMVHVPYKGAVPSIIALLGGQIHVLFSSAISAMPNMKSGRLKALGVTSSQRMQALPDLQTIAEAGMPGFDVNNWYGLLAPAGTPAHLLLAINREVGQIMMLPDVKEKLFNTGVEVVASTPEQFEATVRSEMTRMGKVIRETGMRAE